MKFLKLLCSILYDGYAKYEYHNRHCSSFPGTLSHILLKKWCTQFIYKNKRHKLYWFLSSHNKIRCWGQGGYGCITTLKKIQIKNKRRYILFTNIWGSVLYTCTIDTSHAGWINPIIREQNQTVPVSKHSQDGVGLFCFLFSHTEIFYVL